MKLVWSADTASNAFIDTVKLCENYQESGPAELVSAMAAGWKSRLIVETWSAGGVVATSIGLAVAARHTGGRHICMVSDEQARLEYIAAVECSGVPVAEIIMGDPEESLDGVVGIDFMVVDCLQSDFARMLRLAKLSDRGAVLVCKNANSRAARHEMFRWRSLLDGGSRRLVRSVFLPVGKGLDIAHVATSSAGSSEKSRRSRWIKHVDRQSGEETVIRK